MYVCAVACAPQRSSPCWTRQETNVTAFLGTPFPVEIILLCNLLFSISRGVLIDAC